MYLIMEAKNVKTTRSYIMSQIKGKNTKPELMVRRFLHAKGFRFKIHDKSLPGKPDVVLPKYRTVVEVNGCFWHGHKNCKYFKMPHTNRKYWKHKIEINRLRDRANKKRLKALGWKLLVIWECEIRKANRESTLGKLVAELTNTV